MDTTILFFGGHTILRLPPLEIPKIEDLVDTKLFGYQQLLLDQVTHIFINVINFSVKIPFIILKSTLAVRND